MGLARSSTSHAQSFSSVADIHWSTAHSQCQVFYLNEATCSAWVDELAFTQIVTGACRPRASHGAVSHGRAAKQAGAEGE